MDKSSTLRHILTFLLPFSFLSGCATDPSKSDSGMAIGAILGGILGAQTGDDNKAARILVGTILGGAIGRTIGRYMDENDRKRVSQSLEESEPGTTTNWTNENSGHSYEFTPGDKYTSAEGYECRTFVQEAIINGKREKVDGTACKEPDKGQWNLS